MGRRRLRRTGIDQGSGVAELDNVAGYKDMLTGSRDVPQDGGGAAQVHPVCDMRSCPIATKI